MSFAGSTLDEVSLPNHRYIRGGCFTDKRCYPTEEDAFNALSVMLLKSPRREREHWKLHAYKHSCGYYHLGHPHEE